MLRELLCKLLDCCPPGQQKIVARFRVTLGDVVFTCEGAFGMNPQVGQFFDVEVQFVNTRTGKPAPYDTADGGARWTVDDEAKLALRNQTDDAAAGKSMATFECLAPGGTGGGVAADCDLDQGEVREVSGVFGVIVERVEATGATLVVGEPRDTQ